MLDEEDTKQLKLLNDAVKAAIAARTKWLDEHMPKYAKYAIGEELFDLDTGLRLGTVDSYYRYWAEQRNPTYDTGLNIEYKLKVKDCIFDNTSRHAGRVNFGNRAELEKRRS